MSLEIRADDYPVSTCRGHSDQHWKMLPVIKTLICSSKWCKICSFGFLQNSHII